MNVFEDIPPSVEETQPAPGAKRSPRRKAIIILIWLAAAGGALTWFVFAVRAAREAARCQSCHNNLRQIGLALLNFNNSEGSLPPAFLCDETGKPIHSWQALMMPFVGYYHWQEHYSLKEPWDGQNNDMLAFYPNHSFQCPSVSCDNPSRLMVDYVAVVGPDTMWPGRDRVSLPPKGTGNPDVILIIEMPDSDYRYLEPRTPTVEEFMEKIKSPSGKGIRCIHPKGLAYVTVDGEGRWFPPNTDPETIRRLLKRDSNCKVVPPEARMSVVEHWEETAEDGR